MENPNTFKFLIVIVLTLLSNTLVLAQCCSGGVPLSSNLGLPASQAKVWQMSLSYDLNVLRTLKSGTEVLESGQRERLTHSMMFEVAYGFTDRFSVNAFFSYVGQERTTRQFGDVDFVSSAGIGDGVLFVRYQIVPSLTQGAGAKAPLGDYDRTNPNGNIVSADLQPGSGAWDLILWGMYQTQISRSRPSISFSSIWTFRLTGKNDDFRNGAQVYQFGNEVLITANLTDQFLIGRLLLGPSLGLKYRSQGVDHTEIKGITTTKVPFPNSGGDFIFLNPGITFHLLDGLDYQVNVDIPIWTRVDGTQLSPTFRLNTGVYWRFGGQSKVIEFKPEV